MRDDTVYAPLNIRNVAAAPYEETPPRRLAPPLFAAALGLLLIDALAALFLAGKLRLPRLSTAASVLFIGVLASASFNDAVAQPLDPDIPPEIADAALLTRLAYVKTGDPELDRLSAQALAGLSRELYRRTALEPGAPAGVNPETDDLSVYPFLYWPISPDAAAPSEAALANIENFMNC